MAEKEEKIAIAKMLTGLDDDGSAQLDHFKIYSRQEAIERMAKKIDEAYIDENGCNKGLTMEELAEAALDALLSSGE